MKDRKMANGAVTKYSKVKRYYFEKDAQVQHLQNTVAHQRMAVSRTVLDDNEYANRFGRLDGAIKDLAFSIRKDWKSLPPWLLGYVNDDAHTVGMKEMTAIGRAFMSRWLVEEIFQRHFHPSLDPTFSQQLKSIENNLRHQHQHVTTSPSPNTTGSGSNGNGGQGQGQVPVAAAEDKENAIAKISNWRRTTFDGLGDALLQGPAAEENRSNLTEQLVGRLVSTLRAYLTEPPPIGMDNSARLIVENAVGIAEKIPLESRDVCVEYPLPGSPIDEKRMKVESGVPPLTNVRPENIRREHDNDLDNQGQGQDVDPDDSSNGKDRDASAPTSPTVTPTQSQSQSQTPAAAAAAADPRRKPSSSVFSSLMGKRPPPPSTSASTSTSASASTTAQSQSQPQSQSQGSPQGSPLGKDADDAKGPVSGSGRIRFATFMDAEVQGKGPVNVLARAPVYLLE